MNGTPAPSIPHARPRARQIVLPLALLALVFVVVLPRIVDYPAVITALRSLERGQLLVLIAAAAVAYVTNAVPYWILVRQVSWPRAVGADLAGRAVASTIPGPTDIAARLLLYRQWDVPMDQASASLVLGGLLETVSALVLPLIAVLVIVVGGGQTQQAGMLLAAVGVLVLALGTALFAALVRSQSLARRIGDRLQSVVRWVATRLGRQPPTGVSDAVMRLREELHETLSRDGLEAFGAAVLAKMAWFAVLVLALRGLGIGPEVISPATVLATMAIVSMVALVPITPGALGVSEVAYIGLLTTGLEPAYAAPVAAAVLLYRVLQWLVPIPLGWGLLIVMRRGHGLFGDPA